MCGNPGREVSPRRIIIKKKETNKENSSLPEKTGRPCGKCSMEK
jgi:hypothetical protein